MKLGSLTAAAQAGIMQFCEAVFADRMMPEAMDGLSAEWAWLWFRLREAEDKPAWFPHGKWATLQQIEAILIQEARAEVKAGGGR